MSNMQRIFGVSFSEHTQRGVWMLLTFTFVFLAVGLGLRDPWPADEPRFAQIAREMVESGQWLFPMRGNELYPDKPPIFMWLIASLYWLTDSIRVAFLLPSAIAGTVSVWAVYDITRRIWDARRGWWAAGMLVMSVQFIIQAKAAQIDATVCMWITLGCYGVLRATLTENGRNWWFAACVFMALGIMTKGVGFLPLLMLIPYGILVKQRTPTTVPLYRHSWGVWFGGIGLLFATLFLWLGPMLLTVSGMHDPAYEAYRDNIMLKQTVTRYANAWHHIKPFWFYVTSVVPWAWLPMIAFVPWLLKPFKTAWQQREPRVWLPLGFVLLMLLFFSISSGKRGVYILPALPMLAIACAAFVEGVIERKGLKRLTVGIISTLIIVFIAGGVLALLNKPPMTKLMETHDIQPGAMFLFIGIVSALVVFLLRRTHALVIWSGFSVVLWLTYSTWAYSLMNHARTPINVMQHANEMVPKGAVVALIETGEQFMLFSPLEIAHFGYHTPANIQLQAAWSWMAKDKNRFVLAPASLDFSCFDPAGAEEAGFAHREHWLLLTPANRLPTCELDEQQPETFHYKPKHIIGSH